MTLWDKFLNLLGFATKEEAILAGADVEPSGDVGLSGIVNVAFSEAAKQNITAEQIEDYSSAQLRSLVGNFPARFSIQEINKVRKYAAKKLRQKDVEVVQELTAVWFVGQGLDSEYEFVITRKTTAEEIQKWQE